MQHPTNGDSGGGTEISKRSVVDAVPSELSADHRGVPPALNIVRGGGCDIGQREATAFFFPFIFAMDNDIDEGKASPAQSGPGSGAEGRRQSTALYPSSPQQALSTIIAVAAIQGVTAEIGCETER